MEEVIRCSHIEAERCYYWATHQEAELDLLLFHQGKRLGFEFKHSDAPKLTKSMQIAFESLKLDELTIIYPGTRAYSLTENIRVASLTDYLLKS